MPAKNSIEKVITELNKRGESFHVTVFEVEHYQNVRQSKIVLVDSKNQKVTKSLEKWREFFVTLEETEKFPGDFYFQNIISLPLKERVLAKAIKLNHIITDYKDGKCTVYCNIHQQTYENVSASYYVTPRNKHGVFCCTTAFKSKD